MRVTSAKFIKSVAKGDQIILDNKPIVAFVGRSNVGKSSLLNYLTSSKKLAKTSSTPGRTRLINYFLINEDIYFVDLPGYGFAKGNKTENSKWDELMDPFFVNSKNLKLVCVLMDCRIKPTPLDYNMLTYLNYYQIPYIVVATKCDKLPKTKVKPAIQAMANELGLGVDNIFATSSNNLQGKIELLDKFDQFVEN